MKPGMTGSVGWKETFISKQIPRKRGRPQVWSATKWQAIQAQALFHACSERAACAHANVSYNSYMAAKRKYK